MSTANAQLTVLGIPVEVVRKDIKNLHIGVYPPAGRVRVAVPMRMADEQVRLAVIQRLPWIRKQRGRLQNAARQTPREMLTGESHYVWGSRYRLTVVECLGRPHVELDGDRLLMCVPLHTGPERCRELLDNWYRGQLRQAVPALLQRWQRELGVCVPKWSIRRMKTKWGSCNRETGHIWFNVELAKKHPDGLEYLVVHEMTHLLERTHGLRFTKLMDTHLPDWQARRERLNQAPLGHEEWAGA